MIQSRVAAVQHHKRPHILQTREKTAHHSPQGASDQSLHDPPCRIGNLLSTRCKASCSRACAASGWSTWTMSNCPSGSPAPSVSHSHLQKHPSPICTSLLAFGHVDRFVAPIIRHGLSIFAARIPWPVDSWHQKRNGLHTLILHWPLRHFRQQVPSRWYKQTSFTCSLCIARMHTAQKYTTNDNKKET